MVWAGEKMVDAHLAPFWLLVVMERTRALEGEGPGAAGQALPGPSAPPSAPQDHGFDHTSQWLEHATIERQYFGLILL